MAQALAHREPDTERPQAVLVSAMRNEGPFLLEWVAYHRAIGFGQIVICANASTDGSDALLKALDAAGAITYLPTEPGPKQSPLEAAVSAFETNVGYRDGTWYAWLDADEFLNVNVGARRVEDLIAALGPAQGLLVNWRLFGTSGNDRFGGRFVSTDFVRASKPGFVGNLETKSFFRKSDQVTGFAGIGQERPRLVAGHGLGPQDFLAGNGRPLLPDEPRNRDWLAGKQLGRTNLVAPQEAGHALAQINHYAVRTPEFFRLKQERGRGYLKTGAGGRSRYTVSYFSRFDRNEAEDRSILVWETAVTDAIAQLAADPAIAAAKAEVDRQVVTALRAVDKAEPDFASVRRTDGTLIGSDGTMEADTGPQGFELTFEAKELAFVKKYYNAAKTILEYGSGGSTVLAARLGRTVFSVESDRAWASRLSGHLAPISDRAHVHYADVGPTGAWGAPLKLSEHRKFSGYALSVWDRLDFMAPDLVLIDGRFRAACLVAVLLRTEKPVTVLFDDYAKRGYYHGVERLARKEEMVGRMARFTVIPGAIPADMVTEAIGWFTDPR
jgi:Glycosyl transferase family 2